MTIAQRILLLILPLCGFLVVGLHYVTIPLVDEIATSFSVDVSSAVLVSSTFGGVYAVGFLAFGLLSGRFGYKRMVVVALLATSALSLPVALAGTFEALLIARAAQGFVAAAFPPAALSLLTEQLPPRYRPLGVSMMTFSFLASAPGAQLIGGLPTAGLTALMICAVPAFLVGAITLMVVPTRGTDHTTSARRSVRSQLAVLGSDGHVVVAWSAATTVLFAFVSFQVGIQTLSTGLGIDAQTVRVVSIPAILSTFLAAPLTRRQGPLTTALVGLALAAGGLLIAATGQPPFVIAANIALSAGVALAAPGLIMMIANRTSEHDRGLALAIYSFLYFLGASVAPPAAQALVGFGSAPLMIVPAILLMVAVVAVFSIRKLP